MRFFYLFILPLLLLTGCMSSPVYQSVDAVPNNAWDHSFKPVYKFNITDTNALYNVYFIIRHTDVYPFSNIWIRIYSKNPGDSAFEDSRLEIPLAEQSGKWLGRGMGEIYEQRMPLTRNDAGKKFTKQGTYEVRLEQDMRMNPLPEVLHVGLRVEKIGYRSNTAAPAK